VVSMFRPPPLNVIVWPEPVDENAADAPVFSVFVVPLNVVEPPVLPDIVIPPPASFVSLMLPESAIAPPVRPVMSAVLEVNHAYVTLFHCTFDVHSGELEYIDAGHGHARLLRGVTSQELLPERSAPIGIFPESMFLTGKATLGHGDSLVVFSDGLLDLRPDLATKEVQLPYEARRAASAQEMVDILASGAREKVLADDVTVVALKRL